MYKKPNTVIIGGSGLLEIPGAMILNDNIAPNGLLLIKIPGCDIPVYFLARHGKGHTIPPHLVDEKTNFLSFLKKGIQYVINFTSVGSLCAEIQPGDIVLYDNIQDETKNRPNTFSQKGFVLHVSTNDPFCPDLKFLALKTLKNLRIRHHTGNCVCIEGPTFGDIHASLRYIRDGNRIVGMTQEPQRKLGCEAGLCMISFAMVTDYDCWKKGEEVSQEIVAQRSRENLQKIIGIIKNMVPEIPDSHRCTHCYHPPSCVATNRKLWPNDAQALAKMIFRYDEI